MSVILCAISAGVLGVEAVFGTLCATVVGAEVAVDKAPAEWSSQWD